MRPCMSMWKAATQLRSEEPRKAHGVTILQTLGWPHGVRPQWPAEAKATCMQWQQSGTEEVKAGWG